MKSGWGRGGGVGGETKIGQSIFSVPSPLPISNKRWPLSFFKDAINILHSSDAIFNGAEDKNYIT